MAISQGQITIADLNDGTNGKTYALTITGGIRSVTFDANGSNPAPAQTAFGCQLYENGVSVTPATFSWSATGHLSGTSTTSAFTPTCATTFNANNNDSITLTVTYAGQTITEIIPIAITKTGSTGGTGSAGKGISSVTEYYLATSSGSGVTTSTTGWTTTVQTITSTNKYLWNYEKITYTDNSTSSTTPVIIGVYGDTGGTGSAGKGVSSVTEYYLASSSSSGVTTATAGWTTTIQTITTTNKYLWNYEKVTYTDSSTTTTTPVIIGVYGDTGGVGNDSFSAVLTNDAIVIPTDSLGNNGNFAGAVSTITIFKGTVDDSSNWTVSATTSNVTGSLSGKTYTVTGLSADTGYVDLTAARSGYTSIVKRFTVAKSKTGTDANIGYSTNPYFTNWSSTLPAGYSAWNTSPTKETTITKRGGNAVRFNVAANVDAGMVAGGAGSSYAFGLVPELSYYMIQFDVYINSATSLKGAGLIIDFSGLKSDGTTVGYDRTIISLEEEIPSYQTGRWYQVRKAIPIKKTQYATWQYMRIYVMGNWSGFTSTVRDAKDIIYDYIDVLSIPLQVDKLSAISANIGDITAGNITGVTIDGSQFKSEYTPSAGDTYYGNMVLDNDNLYFYESDVLQDVGVYQNIYNETFYNSNSLSYRHERSGYYWSTLDIDLDAIRFDGTGNGHNYTFGLEKDMNNEGDINLYNSYGLMNISSGGGINIKNKTYIRDDGDILQLVGSTHAYMEFFYDGSGTTRAGWVGYGASGSTLMTLKNEQGDISITPKATANRVNLNGDVYIPDGVGLTIGTVSSANTSNQLIVYNTGDSVILQSDNTSDKFNSGNILWKAQSGQELGRIHYVGTSLSDMKIKIAMNDDTGASNDMIVCNAAGNNWIQVNGDFIPDQDNLRIMGSLSYSWSAIYLANLAWIHWNNDDGIKYDDGVNTYYFYSDNATTGSKIIVGGTTYPSDARLKQNFAIPTYNALDEINKMDIREYQLIIPEGADPTNDMYTKTHLGAIIGQFDGGDGYMPDLLKDDIGNGYYGINLYGMVAMLVKAVQELSAKLPV